MNNPLTTFTAEYDAANAERLEVVRELKKQIDRAEAEFQARMMRAVVEAHAAGVSRYMAQKATGASQPEVKAWFGSLPSAKPGRRRKDDPVYYGLNPEPEIVAVEQAAENAEPQNAVPDGWEFSVRSQSMDFYRISVIAPDAQGYTIHIQGGEIEWFDSVGDALSLDDRLALIPDDVEAYVREADWS